MKARGKEKIGECAYCGKLGALTKDHVPPQNLFPKPRPCNLITVPSCRECNDGFKLDDEYFRLAITAGIDPSLCPNNFALSIGAIHKLGDPNKLGLAKRMLASFSKRAVPTPAGLYPGEVGVLEIDASRIQNVISRIVRGLFFHHQGKRLPNTHTVNVWSKWFEQARGIDEEFSATVRSVIDYLETQELRGIGERVFQYRWGLDNDPAESVWWLWFYEHRDFIAVTLRK